MSNSHPLGRRFLRAVYDGKTELVLQLIEDGIPLDSTHHSGLQALHFAAKSGNVEIAEELLKRGASVNATSLKGSTPLHIAALLGKCDIVKLLLKNGANVNMTSTYNDESFTALYMAAQIGHQEIVTLLLAYGADPTIKTKNGSTAETVATQQGHLVIAQLLAEYEAQCSKLSCLKSDDHARFEDHTNVNDITYAHKVKRHLLRATEVKDTEGLRSGSEDETDTETIKQDTEGSELDDGCQTNGRTSGDEDVCGQPKRGYAESLSGELAGLTMNDSVDKKTDRNDTDHTSGNVSCSGNGVAEKRSDSAKDIILSKIRSNLSPVYNEAIPSPVNSPRRVPRINGDDGP